MKSLIPALLAFAACSDVATAAIRSAPISISPARLTNTPVGLCDSDWSGVCDAYETQRHAVTSGPDGTWRARNPRQAWLTTFDSRGFTVTPDAGGWTWGLELEVPASSGPVTTCGNRVSFRRSANIEEWFVNDSRGLEQGWTIGKPGDSTLSLTLAIRGGLKPRISEDGRGIAFLSNNGVVALNYGGLHAWDAENTLLDVRFVPGEDETRFSILVDDTRAVYPVTIDPIAQQAYLKASNTGAEDGFGCSVAVSGDTVVVGAFGEDSNATGINGSGSNNSLGFAGAAYVFVRTGTAWSQQAYLKASNTGAADRFGYSVAISGDTVVVGAPYEYSANGNQNDNSAQQAGAAYVFNRTGTTWAQQAYLKASNIGLGDRFGHSVAVSGNTVVVGAYGEDSAAAGVNGNQGDSAAASSSGAAYVFVRSGTAWNQQAYLKASNTGAGDLFGYSVAVSGDSVVVGAYGEDSAATGVNGNQGDSAAASSSGAAYVFARTGTAWNQQAYLKPLNTGAADLFGYSVAAYGDTLVVGSPQESSSATGVNGSGANNNSVYSGAAYVFTRSGTAWSQQAYLKASNTGAADLFGFSVSVSDDTVLIGAPQESSSATGVNGNQGNNTHTDSGAAYVFERRGTAWSQWAYLKASNTGISDAFGYAVAVSEDTMVSGAYLEDSAATGVNGTQTGTAANSGAAYLFLGSTAPIVVTGVSLSGVVFTIQFTGEPGVTGWKVKGSDDLVSFADDKTPKTTITEIQPGRYSAAVNVSGEPDRYFLRIER